MHWQKPELPGIVYIKGHTRPAWLSFHCNANRWDIRIIETDVYEPLGDRLVSYIPGPPPEGQLHHTNGLTDDSTETALACAADLVNSWCREIGVKECDNPWKGVNLREAIDRIWSKVSTGKVYSPPSEGMTEAGAVVVKCKDSNSGRVAHVIATEAYAKLIYGDGESRDTTRRNSLVNVAALCAVLNEHYTIEPSDLAKLPAWVREGIKQ